MTPGSNVRLSCCGLPRPRTVPDVQPPGLPWGVTHIEAGPAHSRAAHVWRLQAGAEELSPLLVLPDGGTDIVWNRGDEVIDLASGIRVLTGTCTIVGTHRTASGMRPTGCVDLVGVRLRPGGLFGLVGPELSELDGTVVPAGEVGLRLATDVARPLNEPVSGQTLVNAVEAAPEWRDDPPLRALLRRPEVMTGTTSVAAMAAAAGLSVRQLERRVQRACGHTVKRLLRLRRLDHAMRIRRKAGGNGWATVAASAGFADQAHLSREVLALTGWRPRELDVASVQASKPGLADSGWYPTSGARPCWNSPASPSR